MTETTAKITGTDPVFTPAGKFGWHYEPETFLWVLYDLHGERIASVTEEVACMDIARYDVLRFGFKAAWLSDDVRRYPSRDKGHP